MRYCGSFQFDYLNQLPHTDISTSISRALLTTNLGIADNQEEIKHHVIHPYLLRTREFCSIERYVQPPFLAQSDMMQTFTSMLNMKDHYPNA